MSPRISFDPIDVQIDCDEDETILDAAFRQGWNLVHGCREGQCTACKSFLLEGEVTHETHSPDALSEGEEDQGYTLLCRALPDTDDVVVELLHFDPDNLRLAHPIVDGRATVTAIEELTADIVRLRLTVIEPAGFSFTPGQYVDLHLPGTAGATRRSFSMANVPAAEGEPQQLDLVIRRYPGGRFSSLLGDGIAPGDELAFTGPYGSMALRRGERPVLLVAGGSGLGPVLALLAELAAEGSRRPVRFFYGARTAADLPLTEEIAALGTQLDDFAYVPVLSEEPAAADAGWDGLTGLVHDAAAAALADGELTAPVVCTCGPPPMIEALIAVLTGRHGVAEADIAFDKFTTAADA